jgi:hypothetical protein
MLGGIFELVLWFNRSTGLYIFGTGLAFSLSIPVTFTAWMYLGLPSVGLLKTKLPLLMAVYFVEGILGALMGNYIYKSRLSKMTAVQRMRRAS